MLYKTGECDSQPEGSVRTSLSPKDPRPEHVVISTRYLHPSLIKGSRKTDRQQSDIIRVLFRVAADERSRADVGVLLQEESDLVLGMSVPRAYCAAGVLGGALVVAGGYETNSVELYDLAAGQWRAGPALPESRCCASAAVL
ncbi:hypothetical protein EVAR_35729_1 [Eumeta japonica]|uniref:Uncharacterized protein n=1 Tax=Eumeta variegata TaxID=151549 RepID=A0A4C1VHR7_EUMVA|nr:hypothetical protein EVAR_35729_1 [Eumeta japonica]